MYSQSKAGPLMGLILAMLLLASRAVSQSVSFSNISPQCADPAGFNTCWANVTSTAQTCYTAVNRCDGSCTDENNCSSTRPVCTSNCVCDAYAGWLNCALSHCWNQIYSCEYQNLAMHAHENCPAAGVGPRNTDDINGYIPYSPAPPNAPGGCSCGISFVYYRHYTSTANGRLCAARPENRSTDEVHCRCCAASEQVSAFYNTCPNTTPEAVPLWDSTVEESLEVLNSLECRAALAGGFNCRTIGFQKPGQSGSAFYRAGNVPENGTQTISNTGNAITSPVSGPTLVWSMGEQFPEMTAIAASATSAGAGGSSATTAAGSGSQTGTAGNQTNAAFSVRESAGGAVYQLLLALGMMIVGMAML